MKEQTDLKPCPFCGSRYVERQNEMVACTICHARAYKQNWNQRTLERIAREQTDIYRDALLKIAATIGEKTCKE